MNITQASAEITAALEEAGLRVQGWEQKQVVGPVAIVITADPFLDTNGRVSMAAPFVAHYAVHLVGGRGTGATVSKEVADMTTSTVLALRAYDWSIDEVNYPVNFGTEDNPTIGAQVSVSAAINLKEDV